MDLSEFLLAWRTAALPDREVIDALVHPAHAGPSPALAAALERWPGTSYWSDEPDGRHLVLTRPLGRRHREAWALHLLLFAATLFTTTFVGAVLKGAIPFDPNPLALVLGTYPFPADFVHAWATGLSFAAPLLTILLCHELGHYLTARRYRLDVSPPYFIPAPVVPWSIGTMGAFIRLRTVVSDRRQLLDVGIAGPIAGLGVFVTMLNLLPISQLDGGHILFGALPRWHARVAIGFWALIVALGVYWRGWLLWGALVLVLSRGRLGHPPVLDGQRPLPRSRTLLAWIGLILFLVTFTPIPFRL